MFRKILLLSLPAFVFSQGGFSFGKDGVHLLSDSPDVLEFAWKKTSSSPSSLYIKSGNIPLRLASRSLGGNHVVTCEKIEDWDDEAIFECSQTDALGIFHLKEITIEKNVSYKIGVKDSAFSLDTEYGDLLISEDGKIAVKYRQ